MVLAMKSDTSGNQVILLAMQGDSLGN